MTALPSSRRDRATSAGATAAIVALLGWALVVGLGVPLPRAADPALQLFAPLPPAPPPPREKVLPRPARSHRVEGAAAPANLRAHATEVVAPKPVVVPPPPPPPVVAAVKAGEGSDASAGAAPLPGPGTGAGGVGDGTGSGRHGTGDGDGGRERVPRLLKGWFKESDFPNAEAVIGAGGMVAVRYTVEVDGHVTNCRVTRSSGNAELDDVTCRLIEKRFRYRPWLDADGHPVPSTVTRNQYWDNELGPPDDRRDYPGGR